MTPPPIVVIDHDREYLELVQDVLESEGYERVVGVNHRHAWQTIHREPPCLVFLDIRLPDPEPGWALFDKLRLHLATSHVPVIICTTNRNSLAVNTARLMQLNCRILEKPFLIEELLALVSELIGPSLELQCTA